MFCAIKKSGKKTVYWRPKHWILHFPLTCCRHIVHWWRLVLFVLNLTWNSFTSQNSNTHALFILGNDLLRYVLIDNLEVSFNFHLTLLQWPWLKCSLCSKSCFFPYSRLFSSSSRWLELPITRTFFDFSWRFELSGVDCTYNGHKAILLEKCRLKTTSTRRSSRFSTWPEWESPGD